MASIEKLSERLISGKGTLKIPEINVNFRYYIMYIDVIRDPKNQYSSYDWNPPQSLFARMVFRRDGYALFDDYIRYDRQAYQYINDISGQTLIAVKCAYDGILQSFVNLVNGLAGTPGGIGIFVSGVTDLIEGYENLDIGWNEVLFKCYSDTALQVRFYGLKYDVCDPDKDKAHKPPPPPPPLPKVPPGTPIADISPPYDGEDDGGNTVPYPDDTSPELDFPYGILCTLYEVNSRLYGFWSDPDGEIEGKGAFKDFQTRVYGEVYGIITDRSIPKVSLDCHGAEPDGCASRMEVLIFVGVPNSEEYADAEILSIVPV